MTVQTIDTTTGGDSFKAGMVKANSNDADLQKQLDAISAGNVAWSRTAKIADYTIVAGDLGGTRCFTNYGATGTVNLTLPAGAASYRVTCEVEAAYTLKLTANGTETFRFLGNQTAGGGYIQSATVGTFWIIEWNTTEWLVAQLIGSVAHASGSFAGGGDPLQAEAFIY